MRGVGLKKLIEPRSLAEAVAAGKERVAGASDIQWHRHLAGSSLKAKQVHLDLMTHHRRVAGAISNPLAIQWRSRGGCV
jgi:hypothetical protein